MSSGHPLSADRSEAETLNLVQGSLRFGNMKKAGQTDLLFLCSCGRRDLNPHDVAITRSLVQRVPSSAFF